MLPSYHPYGGRPPPSRHPGPLIVALTLTLTLTLILILALALTLTLPLSRRAARGEMGKRSLGGSSRPAEGQPRLRRAYHARWQPSGAFLHSPVHIMLGRR